MRRCKARSKSARLARALAEQPPDVVAAATNSIREALTPFLSGQSVPLRASIWIVTAAQFLKRQPG